MAESEIIECNTCEARVDAAVVATRHSSHPYEALRYKHVVLECPRCKNLLVAYTESFGYDSEGEDLIWDDLMRVWPEPTKVYAASIPESIKHSLVEARKCLRAKAFDACAVMVGRVLEGTCKAHETKQRYLAGGLKELLDREIIDKRIFSWSEELRKHRNIGAHDGDLRVSGQDAQDLMHFAEAICDYVFVLNSMFDEFTKRKAREAEKARKVTKEPPTTLI